jgi:tape measure domain-containing protein
MATADQIEKIIIDLEEHGAGKAYVNVKRLDDVFGQLAKQQGPLGVVEGFNALQDSLSRSLVALPNMAALTDQAAAATARLVAQVQRYGRAQADKSERNSALEGARADAQRLAAAQRAANRIPTELQQAPPSIDWAGALASQSQKAGSAIEAAAHSALEEATALGEAAQNAQKLASVYDLIKNRAASAARADQRWLDQQMRAANRIPTELQAASAPKGLTGGQKAMQAIGRTLGPKATQGITSVVEGLEKIGPIASKIGPPLGNAAMAIGAVSIAAAAGAVYVAKSFASSVIEAQSFKQDMTTAFEIARKGRGDAQRVMQMAAETSDYLGIDRAKGTEQFLDLLTKFKDAKVVDNLTRSLADLSVADPNAKIPELVTALGKMQGQGKLTGEVLQSLNDNGLEQGDVLDVLAKRYKKTTAEVLKMISAGKVNATEGRTAIEAAIAAQGDGGPVGSAAAKKADQNISGLMKRFDAIPKSILFDIKVGSGIGTITDVLSDVVHYFDAGTKSGDEVRKVTGDLFNALIEGLTGDKVDTKKGITGTLDAIVAGAKTAVPLVRDIAAGARAFAGAAATVGGAIGSVSEWTAPLGGLASIFTKVSTPVRVLGSLLLGPAMLLPELYAGFKLVKGLFDADWGSAGGAFESLWAQMKTAGASMFNEALNIGANLWQGLVQGIAGGVAAVAGAAKGLANSALGAVGSTWKVGSPARAFEELALWGGAGTERGFYKSAGGVGAAAGYMAETALGAATMAPANGNAGGLIATSGGAAGGGVVIHFSPTIIVPGASSPAQAQAIGAAASAGARPEFEAMLGAAARRLRYG